MRYILNIMLNVALSWRHDSTTSIYAYDRTIVDSRFYCSSFSPCDFFQNGPMLLIIIVLLHF